VSTASCISEARLEKAFNFQQTDANFRRTTVWMLKIAILPLNFPPKWKFQPKFCILDKTLHRKKISRQFIDKQKFRGHGILPSVPRHDATASSNTVYTIICDSNETVLKRYKKPSCR